MPNQTELKPVVFLRGSRISLRPFEVADVPQLLVWVNEPEIRQYIARPRPISEAQEREFVEKLSASHESTAFWISDLATGTGIGCCGLHHISWTSRHAELGIFLAKPASRGNGLGAEVFSVLLDYAFDTLNLHRCWLRVYADNERAIRCYERLGFVKEGADREAHFARGQYIDVVRYSILNREWREKRSRQK